MDLLACQRERNVELATVDWLATIPSLNRRRVTNTATVLTRHRFKQITATRYVCCIPGIGLDICILRRSLRSAHKLSEYVDVLLFIFATRDPRMVYAWLIIAHLIETRAEGDESTERSVFDQYQFIGDADFV